MDELNQNPSQERNYPSAGLLFPPPSKEDIKKNGLFYYVMSEQERVFLQMVRNSDGLQEFIDFVEAKILAFESAIGETRAAKQQHVVDREAGTAAQSAKPRIGKFVRGECIVGSANLDICFGAENELSNLPIVTELASAGDAARIDAAVRDLAPFVAEVETGI